MFDVQLTLAPRPSYVMEVAQELAEEFNQSPTEIKIFPPRGRSGEAPVRIVFMFNKVPIFDRSSLDEEAQEYNTVITDVNVADYSIMDPRREEG